MLASGLVLLIGQATGIVRIQIPGRVCPWLELCLMRWCSGPYQNWVLGAVLPLQLVMPLAWQQCSWAC